MREILFRGQKADGSWVEGYFNKSIAGKYYIYSLLLIPHLVKPESIGQFTGLYDNSTGKNKIFEGDILRVSSFPFDNEEKDYRKVIYGNNNPTDYPAFNLSPSLDCDENDLQYVILTDDYIAVVVGNIIDNPGLL